MLISRNNDRSLRSQTVKMSGQEISTDDHGLVTRRTAHFMSISGASQLAVGLTRVGDLYTTKRSREAKRWRAWEASQQ